MSFSFDQNLDSTKENLSISKSSFNCELKFKRFQEKGLIMFCKTLILFTCLSISSLALAAKVIGAGSGGGGDAIMVDGKPVIRDVLGQLELISVENNIDFIQKIPGFSVLMERIAKVNPFFATQIILDLTGVTFYLSEKDLPLLPYGQTTMSGNIEAEVQLASRTGNDVILAPKFFKNEFTKFTLIHEALHGILENNFGPAHHQRIRNIVGYLYKNQSNLKKEDLEIILSKNNFSNNTYNFSTNKHKYVWDHNLNPVLRCYFVVMGGFYKVAEFDKLDCEETIGAKTSGSFSDNYHQAINALDKVFPDISNIKHITHFYDFTPKVLNLDLKKDSLFKSGQTKRQKSWCWSNEQNLKTLKVLKSKAESKMELINDLEQSFKRAALSLELENEILMATDAGPLEELRTPLVSALDLISKNLMIASENETKCSRQYSH